MSMRVAVVGVSHWHTAMHVPALLSAGARIVAVADADRGEAERVAREHGARWYRGIEPLLEGESPELVLAMGKPTDVAQAAAVLIERGVPAIVEKPIGISAADVEPLERAAAERGAFVAVPLVNRYSRLWNKLEEVLQEGEVRRLHAHFRVVNGFPFRYRRMGVAWMLDPGISGGGPLRNLGIHAMHAFLQFASGEEVRVHSAVVHHSPEEPSIEDFGSATLVTPSGIIGTVEAGYSLAAAAGSDTEWRVATSRVYLVDRNQSLRIADIEKGTDEIVSIPSVRERYDEFASDTLMRVRDGRPPLVGLGEFLEATRLVDETYRLGRKASTELR